MRPVRMVAVFLARTARPGAAQGNRLDRAARPPGTGADRACIARGTGGPRPATVHGTTHTTARGRAGGSAVPARAGSHRP